MTQVITNDVSAIQPMNFGLFKSLLIDFNAEMLRRAKQLFPKKVSPLLVKE